MNYRGIVGRSVFLPHGHLPFNVRWLVILIHFSSRRAVCLDTSVHLWFWRHEPPMWNLHALACIFVAPFSLIYWKWKWSDFVRLAVLRPQTCPVQLFSSDLWICRLIESGELAAKKTPKKKPNTNLTEIEKHWSSVYIYYMLHQDKRSKPQKKKKIFSLCVYLIHRWWNGLMRNRSVSNFVMTFM